MFGWTPSGWAALASVINVVLVGVLALSNYLYMRSAAEQAKAAHEQALAASENIKLLKEQIQEQRSLRMTETLVDIRRLQYLVDWWLPKLTSDWGSLSAFEPLLPANWPSMFQIVERTVPSEAENLLKVESRVRNAQTLI